MFSRNRQLLVVFCLLTVLMTACRAKTEPNHEADWVPVDCSDCNGTGKVVYDKDHWFVVNGIEEPGEYSCGICRGTGKVYKFRDDK
jgi:DnaJ-class molecular chaperone